MTAQDEMLTEAAATDVPKKDASPLLVRARDAVRIVERFCYRAVSDAGERAEQKTPGGAEAVEEARRLMALTIGLRRKLDSWRSED